MMPLWMWFGSFVHLALVAAFVCTAVKEDEDRDLLPKTLGFFVMIVLGTGSFSGLIWLVTKHL